jgi:hypothetical protein
MDLGEAGEVKHLREENARLRKLAADLSLVYETSKQGRERVRTRLEML